MDKFVSRYETRRPVWGEAFFDRVDLLERLQALVKAHRRGSTSWVALLGPRKIGKTSILRELQRQLMGPEDLVVTLDLFRLDARAQDVFTALLSQLLAAACSVRKRMDLANRLLARPWPVVGDLAHAISTALPLECVGHAFELLDGLRGREVDRAVVEAALDLPERFARELGPVWVIIDELQELDALNRQRPFNKRHTLYRLMRSVWQDHAQVSYWATGSQVSMLTTLFSDRRSPLHGHFQLVAVSPFAHADAAALLLERTPSSLKARDAREAAELAADLLGRQPFYLQVLGEELTLRRMRLSVKAIKSVIQEILLSSAGRLALHLRGVLEADAGSGQQLAVLRALARGEATLSELVAANLSFRREATHAVLRRLERADLVTRDTLTHRFRVADPALAAYLRVGGIAAEPTPAVLGDQGEKIAARDLLGQGFRPVYQSYRSLGPADLVTLEPGRRLAIQVKHTRLPVYVSETEYQRMAHWAERESMIPLLCQVDPDSDPARSSAATVRYWLWKTAARTARRRRFDEETSVPTALELLS